MENSSDSDPAQYRLQFFQGRSFNLATYTQAEFRNPSDDCWICTKPIKAGPGYVTLSSVNAPGQPEKLQWDWICEECFGLHWEKGNWTVMKGGVDAETHRRFSEHVEETLRRREIEDPPPAEGYDLQSTWTAQEVVWIAAARGLELGLDQASALLWRKRRRLMGVIDSAAYEGIGKMLERYAKTLQC